MSARRRAGLAAAALLAVTSLTSSPAPGAQKAAPKGETARPAAPKVDYAERFMAVCAACHGPDGSSRMNGTPSLAGQPTFYVITQLYMLREGRRKNEAMTAVAKTMSDADLQGFADYIGALPWVPPDPPIEPDDPAKMAQGRKLAQENKCLFCHGADLAGGAQVARLAGQREEYLRDVLRGYHDGSRPGYTQAMGAAVATIQPEDLDILAYFASRLGAAAPAQPGR